MIKYHQNRIDVTLSVLRADCEPQKISGFAP